MKKLLVFTLVVGSVGAVTSAQAQPGRRAPRVDSVVVTGHGHPRLTRSARYASLRSAPKGATHRRIEDERRDLQQIVDISRAWRRSTARNDRYETAMTDRRLEVWLANELRENRRDPFDRRSSHRLVELSRQLDTLHRRFDRGRARRHDVRRKSQILQELITMSRFELQRARARHHSRWYTQVARR